MLKNDSEDPDSAEKREFIRVMFGAAVSMAAPGGERWRGNVVDISSGGVLVRGAGLPRAGQSCSVNIELVPGEKDLDIRADAMVTRTFGELAALRFEALHGIDSSYALRQIVLANASDTCQVEAEQKSHLGLRRRTTAAGVNAGESQ